MKRLPKMSTTRSVCSVLPKPSEPIINNDVTDEETSGAGSDFEMLYVGMRSTSNEAE